MDKETAKALNEWIKRNRKSFVGQQSEYARGWRSALTYFAKVVRHAKDGDLEAIDND